MDEYQLFLLELRAGAEREATPIEALAGAFAEALQPLLVFAAELAALLDA